ncbi:integral membrane protein [Nannizzia gypsea CBS 118893]|uniref:Integral membrane protein n=1 Tax=Arthroderma gypseum (strain ATCC MYA-4604 / CBS 118893) TaxID=535722 RepID=E4V0T0_ARTGP|nr:integral membrane protein [Nannizzia gypsea CBS 118893]EFR03645.1 integral membrane protein [Nannizzia gypsea CBS 118893]
MQVPPMSVIKSWPHPNYENPSEVRGPGLIILTVIFVPLTAFIVMLRLFTRIRISKSFGVDDILIVGATIPAIACGVITVIGTIKFGWSRHVYDVPLSHIVLGLKLNMAIDCLFGISCALTKLSLLCFTRKLTAGTNSVIMKWLVFSSIVIVALQVIIFCIVVIFTCRPVSAYWTLSFKPQECINETAHLLAGTIINIVTDLLVVVLPIPTVMGLKLPYRQRIILALLFGAGFAVCIAGTFKIYFLYKYNISHDKTWASYPVWISGTIELYLGVIAASLASLKPLFARYLPNIMSTWSSQRGTASGYSNSRGRRADNRYPNDGGGGILNSYHTTTTVASATPNGIEFVDLDKKGVMVSKYITYEARNVSKPSSIQSADATSESELRLT